MNEFIGTAILIALIGYGLLAIDSPAAHRKYRQISRETSHAVQKFYDTADLN